MSTTETTKPLVQPPSVKQGFEVYFYIAYSCLLVKYLINQQISYASNNVLFLRAMLILSAIFFICWGTAYEAWSVQIDTVVFNSIYIIINIWRSIPLIKQVWPVKLTKLEEIIFNRNFKNFMTIKQFKHFISKFEPDTFRSNKCQIVSLDQNFTGLYYIAKIDKGYEVGLEGKHDTHLKYLNEGAWAGIIEYNMLEDMGAKNDKEVLWGVKIIVHKKDEKIENNNISCTEENLNSTPGGVTVYKIDIKNLLQLYNDQYFPGVYSNAIHAMWLDYTADYMRVQDLNLIEFDKFLKEKDAEEKKYMDQIRKNSIIIDTKE
jgi:hypothetical protein